jgi:C-type lysozyme/alpha-lactalbumin family
MFAKFVPVALFALMTVACASDAPGLDEEVGEQVGEDQLLAGRRIAPQEVAQILASAGFDSADIPKMVCTAQYESSFYEEASNRNSNGSMDRGLFQINSVHVGGTRGCPSSGQALFNAATNARCAKAVFDMQGIRAWYGYRAHKTTCDNYRVPGGTPSSTPSSSEPDMTNSCRSKTLNTRVEENSCVQSRSDERWYRCVAGAWRNTTSTDSACGEKFPLAN